jgi:hypothetical protein
MERGYSTGGAEHVKILLQISHSIVKYPASIRSDFLSTALPDAAVPASTDITS